MTDELNRWLRAVRPDAGVDDDWAESSEADDVLASVHRKVAGAAGKRTGLYLGKDLPGLDCCVFDVTEPGEYTITLKAGDITQARKATVKAEDAKPGGAEE